MSYFFKELIRGTRNFFIFSVFVALWLVAFIDIFTMVFRGWWFNIVMLLTLILFILLVGGNFLKDYKKRKTRQQMEEQASLLKPAKEAEIRKKVSQNPEFFTHCYRCSYYNHKVTACERILKDLILEDIKIRGREYCLYYEEIASSSTQEKKD